MIWLLMAVSRARLEGQGRRQLVEPPWRRSCQVQTAGPVTLAHAHSKSLVTPEGKGWWQTPDCTFLFLSSFPMIYWLNKVGSPRVTEPESPKAVLGWRTQTRWTKSERGSQSTSRTQQGTEYHVIKVYLKSIILCYTRGSFYNYQ